MTESQRIKSAKAALMNAIGNRSDFGGIGETTLNGQRCLVVFVDGNKVPPSQEEIPEYYDGIKVVRRIRLSPQFL